MPHHPGPFYEVDTAVRQHRDNRASAMSRKRGRDQYHKYIKYSNVNRGQANVPHFNLKELTEDNWGPRLPAWPINFDGCEILEPMPKRQFYILARDAKRCRHHGACPAKRWNLENVIFKRGSKFAKVEALKWMKSQNDFESWRSLSNEDMGAECPTCSMSNSNMCDCDHDEYLTMEDIIAGYRSKFQHHDCTDDSASVVTANADDWSEVESIASWDDFVDVAEGSREDVMSEWSDD